MCLCVSLKVLIRPWTALRWGNTMMIRSQHWWHLRRNGKAQNSSTPFCRAANLVFCRHTFWSRTHSLLEKKQTCISLWNFLHLPSKAPHCLLLEWQWDPRVTWCNPNPVYHWESSSLSLMAPVPVSLSCFVWNEHFLDRGGHIPVAGSPSKSPDSIVNLIL